MNLNFTLVLEIISFLVLLGLLTKFLYKPFMKYLDDRVRETSDAIKSAKEAEDKARRYAKETHNALEMARKEAVDIRNEAKKLGDDERQKIIDESKKEGRFLIEETEKKLGVERHLLLDKIRGDIASVSVEIAEKMLGREIRKEDHKRLIDESISEIENELSGSGK